MIDPHIHLCAFDGVYALREDGTTLEFHDTGAPTADERETIAVHLYESIRRIMRHRGWLTREGELAPREPYAVTPLERLYEAAARDFIPSGTMTDGGDAVVRPRGSPTAQRLGPLLVDVDGVNVHADVRIEGSDREGRERLLRYGLRPPLMGASYCLTPLCLWNL